MTIGMRLLEKGQQVKAMG